MTHAGTGAAPPVAMFRRGDLKGRQEPCSPGDSC